MNPLENQTEAPKPKRGRGRPRGTKNTKKAPTQPLIIKVNTHAPVVDHPQSDLCNNVGVQAGASAFHKTLAGVPPTESITNFTIQPGHPIVYNYNYFWPNVSSKGCDSGMLGDHPISTQHDLEHRNENEAQGSQRLEETIVETQSSHDPNQLRENIAADEQAMGLEEQNCKEPSPSDSRVSEVYDYYDVIKSASLGVNSHMYSRFLDLMASYREENIEYPDLVGKVKALFAGYPELVNRFYYFTPPPESIAVGSTVTISNLGQQILDNNEQSVFDQSDPNLTEYMHDGVPEEVSGSQDDSSARSGSTDELRPIHNNEAEKVATLALDWLQRLQIRLGKYSRNFKRISRALNTIYEARKHTDEINEFDENAEKTRKAYEQQKIVAESLMRDILKDEPDLLEEMETHYTSKKTYPEIRSGGSSSTVYGMRQHRKPPIVITLDDDEDEEPVMARVGDDKVPQLVTLDEDKDTDQQLAAEGEDTHGQFTTLVGNGHIDRQVATSIVVEDTNHPLINLDEDEDQSNGYIQIRTWPSKTTSDLPLLYHCQDRWVHELCSTLSPILIKIKSLRNFIFSNLHVTLFRYNKNDEDDDEEETKRKAVATSECETDDEVMGKDVRGTYRMCPAKFRQEKCSGRTALCSEVLNDEYFTVAHRNKFRGIVRNKEEERMDDYEDARFEVDMLLHRSARTIQVMKELKTKISEMSDQELDCFKLGNELGGRSIMHQHTVKLLYSKENEGTIIVGLQKFPVLFVPGVLKILSVREREWSEFRARWNDFISADLMKFMTKYQRKRKFHSDRRTQKLKRRLLWQNAGSDGK